VPDAYAIVPDAAVLPRVMAVLQALRATGVQVQMHAGAAGAQGLGSMKSQFKRADASGARHALVFGPDEMARGEVTVKSLRDGQGAQSAHPLDGVAAWAATLQSPTEFR
jgi:histidyl-tRNA synthetase